MEKNPNSSRTDRKLIERNRRNQMKALYSKLNSLVPHHNSRDSTSIPDQLGEAANYIKRLQTNLERMKQRKDNLMELNIVPSSSSSGQIQRSPEIQIHQMGSSMVIGLKTGSHSHFIFNETIRILHEEQAEIVNASFSVVEDDTTFHTIHLTVGEYLAPDHGHEAALCRISERLTKFINSFDNHGSC